MRPSTLIQVARAVQAVIDKSWIPQELQGTSFFGNNDLWEYFELGDPDVECLYCKRYANMAFAGSQLRQVFPDLVIQGPDDIYPNVHQTLWGKETCKCQLIRVNTQAAHPEELVFYNGPKTPYWTPEGYTERKPSFRREKE